jgi:hypothetical protein
MIPSLVVAGVLCWTAVAGEAPVADDPNGLVRPIYTRQTYFAIPFRVDASTANSRREPIQVLLYVSTNRGATWELNSQVEPEKGNFLFRAANDGEFWFILRTAIRGDQVQPPWKETPGLRVIVDTVSPKLDLAAERGSSGQVVVRWRVIESHPKPESLTIQYRLESDKPWQSVAIDRMPDGNSGPELVGEATWWLPVGVERVEIRGEVSDMAGNTAVSHAQLGSDLASIPRPRPAPETDMTSVSRAQAVDKNGLPQLNSPERPGQTRLPSSAWRPVRFPQGTTATMVRSQGSSVVTPPTAPQSSARVDREVPRVRVVNTLTFALDYDPGQAALDVISRLEFWGTQDGGRTWLNFGSDPDGRSPMLITVREEGVYGFRIQVRDPGEPSRPPLPGSVSPDVWVIVRRDVPTNDPPQPPSARIVDAQPVNPGRPDQGSGL